MWTITEWRLEAVTQATNCALALRRLYILMGWRNCPFRSLLLQSFPPHASPGKHELSSWQKAWHWNQPLGSSWGATDMEGLGLRTTKRPQSTRVLVIWKRPGFLSGINDSLGTICAEHHRGTYLFTAFWASMRFPARKVTPPIIARYFRVWNMFRWVQ